MENTIVDTTREMTASEFDAVHGGTSHFIATLAATIINRSIPGKIAP